jgi:hypothetical protein
VRHPKRRVFCADARGAFTEAPPRDRRAARKVRAAAVERGDSNTRRTKVVSQSRRVIDPTLRIWCAVTATGLFRRLQETALSIILVTTLHSSI